LSPKEVAASGERTFTVSKSILNIPHSTSQESLSLPEAPRRPLVLTSISQHRPIDRGLSGLIFYRNSLKVLRNLQQGTAKNQSESRWEIRLADFDAAVEPPKRREISSFSIKSKARLQHAVQNATCDFVSQMTLTFYGDRCVIDGKALKAYLNHFLVTLRRWYPGVKYLWVLEFQRNGNPHFHVFTTIPYTSNDARKLGAMWNRVAKGTEKHLKVHQYVPKHRYKRPVKKGEKHGAFCPWSMGDGSYLTYKYLSKGRQKSVPPNFNNVGRFWGTTRKIAKPIKAWGAREFYDLFVDTINIITGEVTTRQQHINRFFRDLRNFHEKRANRARVKNYTREVEAAQGRWQVEKQRKFRSPIRKCCDATVAKGVRFIEQWIGHYQQQYDIPF
jgi:hypothetical protein